jgi:UDP-N-acetylglucosamine/UDP-N-acetylgalactosamine 4-epimerase
MPLSPESKSTVPQHLAGRRRTWLVTGMTGFIGWNLLGALLTLDQDVVDLDGFVTGRPGNLDGG